MIDLFSYHSVYTGGVRWRVSTHGVEVEGTGLVPVPAASKKRAAEFLARYKDAYLEASRKTSVPVELLIACSLTEADVRNPETAVRLEPRYISDEATPHRISSGLCQLLISTAREAMQDPTIDRAWLQNPGNSIRACAAVIQRQSAKHFFDPICVACAYNAGGLYENASSKNRWRLRQYPIGTSHHADRFAEYFNAALQLLQGPEFNGHLWARMPKAEPKTLEV